MIEGDYLIFFKMPFLLLENNMAAWVKAGPCQMELSLDILGEGKFVGTTFFFFLINNTTDKKQWQFIACEMRGLQKLIKY